ncbi:hypothetical protein ABIB17_001727 [Arthrobacter sp. UYEF6]
MLARALTTRTALRTHTLSHCSRVRADIEAPVQETLYGGFCAARRLQPAVHRKWHSVRAQCHFHVCVALVGCR